VRKTAAHRKPYRVLVTLISMTAALALAAVAGADTQDLDDLRQVMRDAVAKAGPAVVQVIVPEMTDLDKAAARRRRRQERLEKLEDETEKSDPEAETPEKNGSDDPTATPTPPAEPDEKATPAPEPEPESDNGEKPTKADAAEKTAVRTGTIIAPEGYVITSRLNVGEQRRGIRVRLPDGREMPAERLGEDVQRDVVLLKIDLLGYDVPGHVRKADMAVGQWVIALGRVLPVEMPSANKGIVSALDRMAGTAIQTDANISALNYGGPLVDLDGRLVAMIASVGRTGSSGRAAMFSDSGIGFAIPIADILVRLDDLKAGKRLEVPFLGIRFNNMRLGKGAQIERVIPATGAEAAGLKDRDIILEIDGVEIESPFQLLHEIGSHKVGDKIAVKIQRGDETMTLHAELMARPDFRRR
jgi:S1-C subfamily serine protease